MPNCRVFLIVGFEMPNDYRLLLNCVLLYDYDNKDATEQEKRANETRD